MYSTLTSVSVIDVHFCHGNFVGFAVNKPAQACCENTALTKSSCCSNVVIDINLDDNQLTQKVLSIQPIYELTILAVKQSDLLIQVHKKFLSVYKVINVPPGEPFRSKYSLNHSFLFYG